MLQFMKKNIKKILHSAIDNQKYKKNNFYTQDVNYNMEQYTESIHKK